MKTAGTCALLGALTAALLGVGVDAAISDSVVSAGNQIASSPYAEAAIDLHVARSVMPPFSCNPNHVDYDAPEVGAMTIGAELDLNGPGIDQVDRFCVRNAGSQPGLVSIALDNLVERELSLCSDSESGAGDETCDDDAVGELASVVDVAISVQGADCAPLDAPFTSLAGATHALGSVRPGKACLIQFHFRPTGDEDARRRAQTDQIIFDVRFGLAPAS